MNTPFQSRKRASTPLATRLLESFANLVDELRRSDPVQSPIASSRPTVGADTTNGESHSVAGAAARVIRSQPLSVDTPAGTPSTEHRQSPMISRDRSVFRVRCSKPFPTISAVRRWPHGVGFVTDRKARRREYKETPRQIGSCACTTRRTASRWLRPVETRKPP